MKCAGRWCASKRLLLLGVLLLLPLLGHGRKSKKAKAKAKRAVALGRDHALGAQRLAERRLPEALESFDRAVAMGGAVHRETRAQRSKTLGIMGRLPEAAAELELALKQDPAEDPGWFSEQWFMHGILLQQLGTERSVEAVESMRTAHRLHPDHGRSRPELLVSLCVAHQGMHAVVDYATKTKYLQDGVDFCDAAVSAAAGATQQGTGALKAAYLNKGMILMHLNRVTEAWDATDSAVNMMPDLKPVPDALEAAAASSPFAPLPADGKMHKLWPTLASQAVYTPAELPFHLVTDNAADSFSTPVWISRADGANVDTMNAELAKVVHAVRRDDPRGNRVSNIGGWQSAKTRGAEYAAFVQEQAGKSSAVRALYAHILHQASSFIEQLQIPTDRGAPHITLKESWVNVNDRGHYNTAHSHLTNTFSGCYYIASGWDGTSTEQDGSRTSLQFVEPWDQLKGQRKASGETSTWSDKALGLPGTLALWPGPLNHSVPVHEGSGERISVAFNLALVLK
jgi:uncharacterized protein (TIGR02466 family)